jgi:hypothetical protein
MSVERDGVFDPADEAAVGGPAREVVREVARAMGFDGGEYRERVTGDVVETARDALFAALLVVYRGDRAAFDDWCADRPALTPAVAGSDDVANVAWHPAPVADRVVAATYQNEPGAAASAVRRQAFGRVYRPLFDADADAEGSDVDA